MGHANPRRQEPWIQTCRDFVGDIDRDLLASIISKCILHNEQNPWVRITTLL